MDSAIVNLKRRQVAALQIAPLGGPYDIFPTGSLRRPWPISTDGRMSKLQCRGLSSLRHMTALMHIFESDDAVLTCRQDKATIAVH